MLRHRRNFIEKYVNSDDEETTETIKIYEKYKSLFKFYKTFGDEDASSDEDGTSFNVKIQKLQSKLKALESSNE